MFTHNALALTMAEQADAPVNVFQEDKKKRGSNFTASEREVLIYEYDKVKDKLNNAKVPQDSKKKVCADLAKYVSLVGVASRTAKYVRNKYHNLHRYAKYAEVQQRKHSK